MKITRTKETETATYGVLEYGDFKCKTIELPWRFNQKNVSCIPPGKYDYVILNKSQGIKYPHIAIRGVRNRSGIAIHRGNFVSELRGCVAVGKEFKDIDKDGIIDVTESTNTLWELINIIPLTGKIEFR